MKLYSIILLSILVLLTVFVQHAKENEGTEAQNYALTVSAKESQQMNPLRYRYLRRHKKDKKKKHKKKHDRDESVSTNRSAKKERSRSGTEESKSSESHKQKRKSKNGGKKHHKGKKRDTQVDKCDCNMDWTETTCAKWDAGNLILTLEQEKCAEECCTREKSELYMKTNKNLLDVITHGFHESEGKKEEKQSF